MASKAPMISETGNRSARSAAAADGFTLIEIVLVLALITLVTSLVLVNFNAFVDRGDDVNPTEVLRRAVREARFKAGAERVTTQLSFDSERGALVVEPGSMVYPLNADFSPEGRGAIRFYLGAPAEGLTPIPEVGRSRLETPRVQFTPDRSSSPFVAEIDPGSGTPERLVFDPFSSIVRTGE